jgi:hypothetical protein
MIDTWLLSPLLQSLVMIFTLLVGGVAWSLGRELLSWQPFAGLADAVRVELMTRPASRRFLDSRVLSRCLLIITALAAFAINLVWWLQLQDSPVQATSPDSNVQWLQSTLLAMSLLQCLSGVILLIKIDRLCEHPRGLPADLSWLWAAQAGMLGTLGLSVMASAATLVGSLPELPSHDVWDLPTLQIVLQYTAAACGLIVHAQALKPLSFEHVLQRHSVQLGQWLQWTGLLSLLTALNAASYAVSIPAVLVLFAAISIRSTRFLRRRSMTLWHLAFTVRQQSPFQLSQATIDQILEGGHLGKLMHRLHQALETGDPLDHVLRREANVPRLHWLELQSGLHSRQLATALGSIAQQNTQQLLKLSDPMRARSDLGRLGTTLIVMLALIGFLMVFMIPKYKSIFEDFDVALPAVTTSVVQFCSGSAIYPLLLVLPGCLAVAFVATIAEEIFGWPTLLDRSPLGGWWRRLRLSDLLRGVRIGVAHRVPLDGLLENLSQVPIALRHRQQLYLTAARIREGTSPWTALRETGWISRNDEQLLISSQKLNTLPWALDYLAEQNEHVVNSRIVQITNLLRLLGTLIMAGLTLIYALAMFVPLITLVEKM